MDTVEDVAPAAFWAAARVESGLQPLLHFGAGPSDVAVRARGRQVYLASPFRRHIEALQGLDGTEMLRGMIALQWTSARALDRLAAEGVAAVSPVVQSIAMLESRPRGGLGDLRAHRGALDDPFWTDWSRLLLEASGAVWVPAIEGWAHSDGIRREALWALSRNMLVFVEARDDAVA